MRSKSIVLATLLAPILAFSQKAPEPYGVLPSERQLKWHEMEMYCLIHFTPTTFQDKEWGFGDADPSIFNPTKFDADQIARAAHSAGFKGLISVAKHHDGFCLWPTKTTDYSIASSPWKDGKGDMVRDFMEASHKYDMQFGVYLSAWDRNDTRYGTAAYTEAYREQLTELMTQYGALFTSWHDGANGGDGYYGGKNEKRIIDQVTYYEWHEKTWPIVRKYQPMASIFSDIGPDMRWVGNEKGFAAETSWATLTPIGRDNKPAMPGSTDPSNLPTGTRNGQYWIPAECDVPHRKGWFYHANEDDKVKTPNELFTIYLNSVGRGGNMNLGLAPMPEGYLHDNDVKSLAAFGRKVEKTFEHNLADGAKVSASHYRGTSLEFSANNILDDDRYSYYAPEDHIHQASIDITLPESRSFDIIRLRENIKLGQRLDSVQIEILQNNKWEKIASATSIGANRLIKLATPITTSQLRVKLFAPVAPTLSDFALFKEFDEPFAFDVSTNDKLSTLESNDYQVVIQKFLKAFDNNLKTILEIPVDKKGVVIELKKDLKAIGYVPRQDGRHHGIAKKYAVYSSKDGKTWNIIKRGEFSNILANPIEQIIEFGEPIAYKFIKFVPEETTDKSFSVAEFKFYK